MDKNSRVEIEVLKGREIIPYINKIAELRITIFREYPYLYEGTMSYEKRYLHMYSQTEESILVIAKDNEKVVGVITGLPILASMEEIRNLFLEEKISMNGIFYLGEILLLKEYRKKHIGNSMYLEFEKAVKCIETYEKIALCEIDRGNY